MRVKRLTYDYADKTVGISSVLANKSRSGRGEVTTRTAASVALECSPLALRQ